MVKKETKQAKSHSLQILFEYLAKEKVQVSVLVNGIKLQGQVESFDQYVILSKAVLSN